MIQKLKASCHYLLNKFNFGVAFAFCSLTVIGNSVFAQGGPTVVLDVPDLGWANLASDLMEALTPAIVGGIGIALSVWVVYACVKFFRRAAG